MPAVQLTRPRGRRRTWKRVSFALWALGLPAWLSCRSRGNASLDASPPPSLTANTTESARARDDLWRRARNGDPLDLARLADREGAGGLLEGLEEGGPIGVTALEALAFADDAEAAFQRLGEVVRQIDPGETAPFIRAISAIALRPRRQTEPVDPDGLRSCADAVLELSRKKGVARSIRAPAITALRLLSERHALDPAAIPTELDAK